MFELLYNIRNDIDAGEVDEGKLFSEIVSSVSIEASCITVNSVGSILHIQFKTEPTAAEKTIVRQLVKVHRTHQPIQRWRYNDTITPIVGVIKDRVYRKVAAYTYRGALVSDLKQISFLANMDLLSRNYSIRVFDRLTNTTVCEATYSNTISEIKTMSNFTFVPEPASELEVHVKLNSDYPLSTVTIESIVFYTDLPKYL